MPDLPTYTSANGVTFSWGDVNGPDFRQAINAAYAEVTHWRRNVFLVPSGEAGKEFVLELARLFRTYAESSALESIALTAAMVLPTLLLQKPPGQSKAKDHVLCLGRRMQLWKNGNINELVIEGRVIQEHLESGGSAKRQD